MEIDHMITELEHCIDVVNRTIVDCLPVEGAALLADTPALEGVVNSLEELKTAWLQTKTRIDEPPIPSFGNLVAVHETRLAEDQLESIVSAIRGRELDPTTAHGLLIELDRIAAEVTPGAICQHVRADLDHLREHLRAFLALEGESEDNDNG